MIENSIAPGGRCCFFDTSANHGYRRKDSKYFEKDGTNSQYLNRAICYNLHMLEW